MRRCGTKILIIVLIVIAVLAVAGGVFAYVYFGTEIMRTGQELFGKYLMQNVQEIEQTVSFKKLNEIEEKLEQSKYEENIVISQYEVGGTEPNMKITIDTQKDTTIKKMYSILGLSFQGLEEPIKLEYMQENDMYSLRFTNSVKQFFSVENSNLKQFAKNLGADEEALSQIPDKIDFEQFSFEEFLLTDEEINTEINKYLGVLYNNIPEEKYEKNKDSVITVNGKTITTNAYTLTLNMQDIKNIDIKFLETLKQDEIILAKLQLLNDKVYEYLDETEQNGNLKDSFVESIQESIDSLNNEPNTEDVVEEENIIITVYEEKGKTVRIKLEKGLDHITLDTTETDGKKQIDIDFTSIDEENTQLSSKLTFIKENDNKLTIQMSNVDGEEQYNTNLNIELIEDGNNTKINTTINTEESQIVFSRNINILDEINYNIVMNSSNNIVLNDLSLEEISNIFNLIGESLTKEYVEPLQSAVEPILMTMMDNSYKDTEFSDMEIQLFNAKFLSYERVNVTTEEVNLLLNTVLASNKEETSLETGHYVTVTGDVELDFDALSVTKLTGNDYYTVECKMDTDGWINEIVILNAEENNEILLPEGSNGDLSGGQTNIVDTTQNILDSLNPSY